MIFNKDITIETEIIFFDDVDDVLFFLLMSPERCFDEHKEMSANKLYSLLLCLV